MTPESLQIYRACIFITLRRCLQFQSHSSMSTAKETKEDMVAHQARRSRSRSQVIQVIIINPWDPITLRL